MSRRPSIRLIGSRLWRVRARKVITTAAIGLALVGFATFVRPSPWLVWNASASAHVGLYRIAAGSPARGDLVLAHPPKSVSDLAAERGYLPRNTPLVKRLAALPGEHVCAFNDAIIIGGEIVAHRLATDGQGRSLPWWNECRQLADHEVFLLGGDKNRSFDSRYFGPVPAANIIGRLAPLWTE
ncbi:chromosome segregation protein ParM [Mesorhizobium tianshanense]|uniref:Signal peptidase I n=1 Tax=Mesorhizobium tianshanense TaxID=39844 RepID=A0A562N4G5_9HYPH|nr:signal peptidase I [Mesorhizobium tianshanense]TWI26978.1 signal peptidase I/conjugative transfer signal peptidase TraF,TIGR02771 [Mesorhizobium tianshanense]GLS35455.1 chromosome segregation protein ParM [Mesorhizobium tianshanense]